MCGIIGIIGEATGRRRADRGAAPARISRLRFGRGRDPDRRPDRAAPRRGQARQPRRAARARSRCSGTIGIGHTRWATHGLPTETNAHPIATDRVAVVHNGIIENFQALRRELTGLGHQFQTQTDTEAVAILATHHLAQGLTPAQAVARTLERLEGAFALVFLFAGEHDLLICARRGSPLAIGYGDGEMFVGSDALALAPLTRRITYLEEGDWAVVTRARSTIFDRARPAGRARGARDRALGRADRQGQSPPFHAEGDLRAAGGDRRHAACADQPGDAAASTCRDLPFALGDIEQDRRSSPAAPRIMPGMVAKYWLERLARIPVEVDIASEFRYRAPAMPKGGAALFISQSGETADTLAALRYCRDARPEDHRRSSTSRRARSRARPMWCCRPSPGPRSASPRPRRSRPSSPSWPALTVALARARGTIDAEQARRRSPASSPRSRRAPARSCTTTSASRRSPPRSRSARDVLYLGRGTAYPLALEGALKLKEISYIHAEGYAAGEMKHGPIALIDDNVPVIVLAPPDDLFEKTAVECRGGHGARRPGRDDLGRRRAWRGSEGRFAFGIAVPHCDAVRRAAALRDPDPAPRLPRRRAQGHRRRPAAQPREERHGGVVNNAIPAVAVELFTRGLRRRGRGGLAARRAPAPSRSSD